MVLVDIADSGDAHSRVAHEDLHGRQPHPSHADDAERHAVARQDVGVQHGGRTDAQKNPAVHGQIIALLHNSAPQASNRVDKFVRREGPRTIYGCKLIADYEKTCSAAMHRALLFPAVWTGIDSRSETASGACGSQESSSQARGTAPPACEQSFDARRPPLPGEFFR